MKDFTFTMRMSIAEMARLRALAKHYNITCADVIRMLLKREADAA